MSYRPGLVGRQKVRQVAFLRVRLGSGQEGDERVLNTFLAEVKIKKIVPTLVQNTVPNFWSVYVEYEENQKELESKGVAPASTASEVPKPKNLEKIRQQYQRAYEKWTDEEDARLKEEYGRGLSIPILSQMLQRQPGAVSSRLQKLGLIEWTSQHRQL